MEVHFKDEVVEAPYRGSHHGYSSPDENGVYWIMGTGCHYAYFDGQWKSDCLFKAPVDGILRNMPWMTSSGVVGPCWFYAYTEKSPDKKVFL